MPRGHEGGKPIMVEEVEHEDDTQDDGPWYVVESDKNEDSNRAK